VIALDTALVAHPTSLRFRWRIAFSRVLGNATKTYLRRDASG
jgi:hypothetical protein